MEILSSFGIHWTSFVAQIINFGILVFVLSKLVYKPLMNALAEREKVIKKLSEDSSKAENLAEESALKQKEILDEARKQADKIIKSAEASSETLRRNLTDEAKKESEKIIKEGEKKIKEEQDRFYAGLKEELAGLVATGIEKTVGKYVTKEINHKLVEEALTASVAESKHGK